MAKITRKLAKIFGISSGVDEIAQFGSLNAGSPAFSTDPETIQGLSNWSDGWFEAVEDVNSPAIEDMNGFCYVMAYQIAYLLQQGVAEWNAQTTYYQGNMVNVFGVIYYSILDNNLNHVITDPTWWAPMGLASGSITNSQISPTAGIVDTKLSTIATAGKVSNSATTATSANTASTIVARDGSGNFSAGTITAALSGNATTATTASTATTATTATNVSGIVAPANGGTGIANNASSTIAVSGNFATTLTVTAGTAVTLPTTGTLATRAGAETLTNKTLTAPVIATIVSGSATSTLSTLSTGTGTLMPGSNWTSYTPVFTGFGTVSSATAFWRRVGDTLEVRGKFVSGTSTGATAYIGIPTTGSITIDSAKISADQTNMLGFATRAVAGNNNIPLAAVGPWVITDDISATSTQVNISPTTNSGSGIFVLGTGSGLLSSGEAMSFVFSVPITQWAF